MTVEVRDFRKPARLHSGLVQQLHTWLNASCSAIVANWSKQFSLPVELRVRDCQTARAIDLLAELSDTSVCYDVALGRQESATLLALPRPFAIALALAVLGDVSSRLPADRDMTPVESSLSALLAKQVVAGMQDSWPGDERLPIELRKSATNLKRSPLLNSEQPIVACQVEVSAPFGQEAWYWILAGETLTTLLGGPIRRRPVTREVDDQTRLEALVRQMSTAVSVRLGSTLLDVTQMDMLGLGDLVILDQQVTSPLRAYVADQEFFRVWPGRVDSQRAFAIESPAGE